MLHVCVQTFDVTGNFKKFWELNMALERRKFFSVTSDVSEGCREEFLDINKKNKLQNPSENYETNLMILINLSLAHVGYCGT
jgi:hypothetical protein